MDRIKPVAILNKFKEYVISFMAMLMGVGNDYDNVVMNNFENTVRKCSDFSEMLLVIHRIYSSTMRNDKTVKNLELQKQIYAEMQQLCTIYVLFEKLSNMTSETLQTLMNGFGNEITPQRPMVKVNDPVESDSDSSFDDEDSDLDSDTDYSDMPPLMEAEQTQEPTLTGIEHVRQILHPKLAPKVSIASSGVEFVEYMQQREEARLRLLERTAQINATIDAQKKIVESDQTVQRVEHPNRFTAAASRLDRSHAGEMLNMLNAIKQ